jgi:hypothetical protein
MIVPVRMTSEIQRSPLGVSYLVRINRISRNFHLTWYRADVGDDRMRNFTEVTQFRCRREPALLKRQANDAARLMVGS